jgi:hypothetical protein
MNTLPPMTVTALSAGAPINSLSLLSEYANSPAVRELGIAVVVLRLILIV